MTLSLSSARASALSGISGVSHDALKPPKACLPLTKTMVIKPGIRCRQRIELSGFSSTSSVRFFWFCSAVGGVGKPEACPCRPQRFAAERI
jgi:hypothetical protein